MGPRPLCLLSVVAVTALATALTALGGAPPAGPADAIGLAGNSLQAACTPSAEVCDGCDNDCDGVADNGIAAVPCGLPNPPNCAGTMTCVAVSVPVPGGCTAGAVWGACSNNPQPEICDGLDNDCNGTADDGVPPVPCVPAGVPPGLVYGGSSQCEMGLLACGPAACVGFVGPSAEVCDGIDNDCDGMVDDGVVGVGEPCGINQPPCTPGLTACVAGALVCQGGIGPQPEQCDGIDNNCNGFVDDPPLSDAPPAGQGGCWTLPGNCCSFAGLTWCPPPGGTCSGTGSLVPPCAAGLLTCTGAAGWTCSSSSPPTNEICDGIDNDCDGAIDDGMQPVSCVPAGMPPGLVYGGSSQCTMGLQECGSGVCTGFVGPSAEVCDGIDNDCDGAVDEGAVGVGEPCGINLAPCTPGVTVCVAGALVCQGGIGPQPEQCDGIDNNCNGFVDDPPLSDAPPAGQGGCWTLPGNCCSFAGLTWCPPPGGTCSGTGSLVPPCAAGLLTCTGAAGWTCSSSSPPTNEICDGIDNDCDGAIDDGMQPVSCVPAGMPPGLVYGGSSQCTMGLQECGSGVCAGFVGPSSEVCDGVDNDCDGMVDEGVVGVGVACGFNQPPCTPGTTACVNGALVCQGGVWPQSEVCDGIDNNCNGFVDDPPLADAPPVCSRRPVPPG